jgi:DNA-binding response OmpR family regulator
MPISSTSSGFVLIVDDDPAVLLLTRKALTQAGYTVLIAANTSSAERLLQTYGGQIRLVILDIIMPGVNRVAF